jgi:hypothetical protein
VINVSGTAERSITVPAGTAFFFPVLNVETDNVGTPKKDRLTASGLRDLAGAIIDTATDVHATLNGRPLTAERIVSLPFAYHLPDEDNIYQSFGIDITGTVAPAVSDGYWVYIPPLPKGDYDLNSGGTLTFYDPDFTIDITYHIHVE